MVEVEAGASGRAKLRGRVAGWVVAAVAVAWLAAMAALLVQFVPVAGEQWVESYNAGEPEGAARYEALSLEAARWELRMAATAIAGPVIAGLVAWAGRLAATAIVCALTACLIAVPAAMTAYSATQAM